MNIEAHNSGILDESTTNHWHGKNQSDPGSAMSFGVSFSAAFEDLIANSEIEAVARKVCTQVLAGYGITAWADSGSCIKFWSNGVDAILNWHVTTNPINRLDPPICLLSIRMAGGEAGTAFYASVIADAGSGGVRAITQAVRSLVFQATDSCD